MGFALSDMQLTSTAFEQGGPIPKKHTGEGVDKSPALSWSDAPEGTKAFAVICHDPDAPLVTPAGTYGYVHWVLYNIPPEAPGLVEGVTSERLPAGALEGLNDWKRTGYGGPCPPIGRHRYFHKLYALDTVLAGMNKPTKAQVEAAMQGHIIAEAQLMGTHQKSSGR